MCTNNQYYTGLEPWQILQVDKDCVEEELEGWYKEILNSLNMQFEEGSVERIDKLVESAYKIMRYARSYYVLMGWDAAVEATTDEPVTIIQKKALEKALALANLVAMRKFKRKAENENLLNPKRRYEEPCSSSDAIRRYQEEDASNEVASIPTRTVENNSDTKGIAMLKKLTLAMKKLMEENKVMREKLNAAEKDKKYALLELGVLRKLLLSENTESTENTGDKRGNEDARATVGRGVATGRKVYPCGICGKIYQQQPSRSRHMKTHSSEEIRRSKEQERVEEDDDTNSNE